MKLFDKKEENKNVALKQNFGLILDSWSEFDLNKWCMLIHLILVHSDFFPL